jgi:hypothetical protein
VAEDDGERHQFGCLVAREPVHHALVAGALFMIGLFRHSLGNVGRLAVDGDQDAGVLVVDAEFRIRITDLLQGCPDDPLDVRVSLRRHLSGDDDGAGGRQAFDGDAAVGILGDKIIEDRIADLIADLIRMPLGNGLARDKGNMGHRFSSRLEGK